MDCYMTGLAGIIFGGGALVGAGVMYVVMRKKTENAVVDAIQGAQKRLQEEERQWNIGLEAKEKEIVELQASYVQAYNTGFKTGKAAQLSLDTTNAVILHEKRDEKGRFASTKKVE